jgi:hypothetical protein
MAMGWKPWNDLHDGQTTTGDPPLANYGVSGYAFKQQGTQQGTQHVVYQGRNSDGSGDGYIHELWSDAPLGGHHTWHHHDLIPDATGGPVQTADASYLRPFGYAFDQQGTQHVLYQGKVGGGADGHIHELWWDGSSKWHHHDHTADLGHPVSHNPFGYEFSGPWGGQQFIVYAAVDGQIRELRWDAHDGRWHHWSLHEAIGPQTAPLALWPPTAYVVNSQWRQRHVLYVGTDNLVRDFYWEPSGHWHLGTLTGAATNSPANGIPTGFALGAEQFVHYRGTDSHIHQVSWDPNAGWRPRDLTDNFGGPLAADAPPTGYVFNGELHVQYLGIDSHIHEYWSDGNWQHQDLTIRTGAPLARTGPSAYVFRNTQHVVFIATNSHIIELLYAP